MLHVRLVMPKASKFRNTKIEGILSFATSSPCRSQSCWRPSNREKAGAVGIKCPSWVWLPSGGYFLGMFSLVGWGTLLCGKMCRNQLINSSQVTLKGSNRCMDISFFLPLCSVMLAGEIRDYTEHLYHTTCQKYTMFTVTEQATIKGFSLLQKKLHFPLTTSLKIDLL